MRIATLQLLCGLNPTTTTPYISSNKQGIKMEKSNTLQHFIHHPLKDHVLFASPLRLMPEIPVFNNSDLWRLQLIATIPIPQNHTHRLRRQQRRGFAIPI